MRLSSASRSVALFLISLALSTANSSASSISGPQTVIVGGTPDVYYVVNGTSGAQYDVLQQSSWTNCEAEAQALGTNLITIGSATQNTTVMNDVGVDFSGSVPGLNLAVVPLWIGLNDKSHDPLFGGTDDGSGSGGEYGGPNSQHAADFVWADGSTATYRNWSVGEPNDYDGPAGEYYTALNWFYAWQPDVYPTGLWNDAADAGTSHDGGNTGTSTGYYGIAAVQVPEPSSLAFLAIECIFLSSRNRDKRNKNAKTAIIVRTGTAA